MRESRRKTSSWITRGGILKMKTLRDFTRGGKPMIAMLARWHHTTYSRPDLLQLHLHKHVDLHFNPHNCQFNICHSSMVISQPLQLWQWIYSVHQIFLVVLLVRVHCCTLHHRQLQQQTWSCMCLRRRVRRDAPVERYKSVWLLPEKDEVHVNGLPCLHANQIGKLP